MKGFTLVVVSTCFFVFGCGDAEDPQEQEIARLRAENAALHETIQTVNSVYADLESSRSNMANDTRSGTLDTRQLRQQRVDEMRTSLKANRAKISELEVKTKTYQGNIAELQTIVDNLKQTLQEREEAITQMSISLEAKSQRLSEVQFERKLKYLAKTLESKHSSEQATAAQTVRDLHAAYPDRSYSPLVIPLMRVMKNTDADTPVRMLAALALHELHSERGDFAIRRVGEFTSDSRLKKLCASLNSERMKQENLARAERNEGQRLDAVSSNITKR